MIRPHKDQQFFIDRIGETRAPVIIIDNFMEDPEQMVELAVERCCFRPNKHHLYPGVQAPVPMPYPFFLWSVVANLILENFGVAGRKMINFTCDYALVTTKPTNLSLLQRLPHVDSAYASQIAMLHFLCDRSHGGTAFFRHAATGFDSITPERVENYDRSVAEEVALSPPPLSYVQENMPGYHCLQYYKAKFNRVLIYSGNILHSGIIPAEAALSDDPRTGRLTINTFLNFTI